MASRFSVTLFHFSEDDSGGKNGWSVPKRILLLPVLRLGARWAEDPDPYLAALDITSLTNPSSSGP